MPDEAKIVVLLLHLLAMLFMAAPLYMLIIVNERGRFSVPPGYNTDRYLENIVGHQAIRCYAYLAVIVITGVLLTWDKGWIWTNWALIMKLVATATLAGLLTYVHLGIQPHVEQVFTGCGPGEEIPTALRPTLMKWRGRRKKLAGVCLALVLVALIMGLRVTYGYAPWLAGVFVVVALLFSWRAYRRPLLWGWF